MQQVALSVIIQAVLGAGVLLAIYYLALATAMQDSLVVTNSRPNVRVVVAAGKVPLNTSFVSDDRLTMSGRPAVDLPRSMNSRGGAQFSYAFWVKLPEYGRGDFKRVVLYRGDKTLARFVDTSDGNALQLPLAFCPMVIVARAGRETRVSCHINTQRDKNFSATAVSVAGEVPENWTKWNLVTVTVSDEALYGASTDGAVAASVWVNQVEHKQIAPAAAGGVLENSGDLHVLPTDGFGDVAAGGDADVELRDLEYANFALGADAIYAKIAAEADRTVVPYRLHRQDTSAQAFGDLSFQHLSV